MCVTYEHNAFIFNWVDNYDVQINTLKSALKSHGNRVKVFQHLSAQELLKTIDNRKCTVYICKAALHTN